MTNILVTGKGLSAITNATAGGFLVDLTTFSVTQSINPQISIEDTVLNSAAVYSGAISSIEIAGPSTVTVNLVIPRQLPTTGSWELTELGLFLLDGTLFAHGVFTTTIEKINQYEIDIKVYVTAARLLEALNLTIGNLVGVAGAARISSLPTPQQSSTNLVEVLDQINNKDEQNVLNYVTSGIALKSGPGGIRWSFSGYSDKYEGSISFISTSSFSIDVQRNGFWLNDNEIVIVQCIAGPGTGYSRKMAYSKTTNDFTVTDKAFPSLDSTSLVVVWRSNTEILPTRDSYIPYYCVLGIGDNSYTSSVTTNSQNALIPTIGIYTGTGSSALSIPDNIPYSSLNLLVAKNGIAVAPSDYTKDINGNLVFTHPILTTDRILVLSFLSQTTQAAYTVLTETFLVGDGIVTAIQLPVIPDSLNHVLVTKNNQFITTGWNLSGTQLVFSTPPAVSDVYNIIIIMNLYGDNATSQYEAYQLVTNGSNSYTLAGTVTANQSTLVFLDGHYLPKSSYSIVSGAILFFVAPTVGQVLYIINFNSYYTQSVTTKQGINTGPVWADPAGIARLPNSVGTKLYSFVVVDLNYVLIDNVPVEAAIVFVHNVYQDSSAYTISNGVVQFVYSIPSGWQIDIMTFTLTQSNGSISNVNLTTTQSTTNAPLTTIPYSGNVNNTLLFVGNLYQHSSTYSMDGTTLTLPVIPPINVDITIFEFTNTPSVGKSNQVHTSSLTLNTSNLFSAFDIDILDEQSNLLVFTGGILQNADYIYYHPVDPSIYYTIQWLVTWPVSIGNLNSYYYNFLSGNSASRLITRDLLRKILNNL
jgi:hypothetical protein